MTGHVESDLQLEIAHILTIAGFLLEPCALGGDTMKSLVALKA